MKKGDQGKKLQIEEGDKVKEKIKKREIEEVSLDYLVKFIVATTRSDEVRSDVQVVNQTMSENKKG